MTLKVDATYENGVFVPTEQPALADHERVRLTIETVSNEPGAMEIVRRRGERRIQLDPQLAEEIARSSDFNPEGT
ncbi:MAG: antitoxin family protein [Tepidisphaeraceae bacterium]|jgi:predicted DNA-binding antitoxin AbrB/MazE fold protein